MNQNINLTTSIYTTKLHSLITLLKSIYECLIRAGGLKNSREWNKCQDILRLFLAVKRLRNQYHATESDDKNGWFHFFYTHYGGWRGGSTAIFTICKKQSFWKPASLRPRGLSWWWWGISIYLVKGCHEVLHVIVMNALKSGNLFESSEQ